MPEPVRQRICQHPGMSTVATFDRKTEIQANCLVLVVVSPMVFRMIMLVLDIRFLRVLALVVGVWM